MWRYLIRRILWAILLFIVVTFVTFVIFFMGPADPARTVCGGEHATGRCITEATEKLGLNKRRSKLTTDHFAKPKRGGQQLSLF